MPGSHIQNTGSSIQEEVTERGVQQFSALEKTESTKSEDSYFFHSIFPNVCFFSEVKFSDSSLRHFLSYAGATVLDMASCHVMALYSAPDQTFERLCSKKEQPCKYPLPRDTSV